MIKTLLQGIQCMLITFFQEHQIAWNLHSPLYLTVISNMAYRSCDRKFSQIQTAGTTHLNKQNSKETGNISSLIHKSLSRNNV